MQVLRRHGARRAARCSRQLPSSDAGCVVDLRSQRRHASWTWAVSVAWGEASGHCRPTCGSRTPLRGDLCDVRSLPAVVGCWLRRWRCGRLARGLAARALRAPLVGRVWQRLIAAFGCRVAMLVSGPFVLLVACDHRRCVTLHSGESTVLAVGHSAARDGGPSP